MEIYDGNRKEACYNILNAYFKMNIPSGSQIK